MGWVGVKSEKMWRLGKEGDEYDRARCLPSTGMSFHVDLGVCDPC